MISAFIAGLLTVCITTECMARALPTARPDPTPALVPPTSTSLPTATSVPPSPTSEPTATPTPAPTATSTPVPPSRQFTQSVESGISWLDDRGASSAVPKVPGTVLKLDKTSDGDVARYYFGADAPKLYGQDPQQFPIRVGELAGEYYPNVFLYTGTYTTPIGLRVGMLSLDPAIVKAQYLDLAARRTPADKGELVLALPWQLASPTDKVGVFSIDTLYGTAGFGFTLPERTKVIAPFFPDLPSREVAFFYALDRTSMGTAVMISKAAGQYLNTTIAFDAKVFYDMSGPLEINFGEQQRTHAGVLMETGASTFKAGNYLVTMIGNDSLNVQAKINVVTHKGQSSVSEPFRLMEITGSLVTIRARR